MSKKTIVLADNSYTIRRIVELSFSEEQEIQLVSFENSLNLREKLLELRPQIVLVDIKLPEFNGYQVCKFVQDTPSLQHSKVFLLKGGFEPIDENQLKNLRYVDIITKPFDSNALVSNVKKLLEEMPEPGPVTAAPAAPFAAAAAPAAAPTPAPAPMEPEPEIITPPQIPDDLPEIDAMSEAEGEISFSDIKDEIDSDVIMAGEDFAPAPASFPDDEILPSEEITQAQSSHAERDNLAVSSGDDYDNPFEDDMSMEASPLSEDELDIKRNIALQEKELEIGSLTVEEMNIKQDIERMKQAQVPQEAPGIGLDDIGAPDFGMDLEPEPAFAQEESKDDDTSEMFPGQGLDAVNESEPLFAEAEPSQMPEMLEMPEMPEMSEPRADSVSIPETPAAPTFAAEDDDLFGTPPEVPQVDYEAEPTTVAEPEVIDSFSTGEMDLDDLDEPEADEYIVPPPEPQVEAPAAPLLPEPPFMDAAEEDVFGVPQEPVELLTPEPIEPEPEPEPAFIPEPEPLLDVEPEPEPEPEPVAFIEEPMPKVEPQFEPPQPEPPKVETVQEAAPTPAQHEEILHKIEDKLSHAIKEMLWEIVPPLAEKIIKEEIAAITAETASSFK